MVDLHTLSQGGSFDPITLNQLSAVLDNIWIEVGYVFAGQPRSFIDDARTVVARCLLYHSGNGHRDASTLKELALEALAQAHPVVRL